MSRFFIILLVAFLPLACVDKNKVPEDIIQPEPMRRVMWDLARADQFVADYVTRDSLLDRKQESLRLYESVFAIHKIKREDFKKSMDFYRSRPDLLRTLMDSLYKLSTRSGQEILDKADTSKGMGSGPDTSRPRIKGIRKRMDSVGLPVQPQ